MRNADYDATMEMMTADGTEDADTQKSDIEIAKRMLNVQKDVPVEQIFDFRFTREVYKELRDLGWERALKAGSEAKKGKESGVRVRSSGIDSLLTLTLTMR